MLSAGPVSDEFLTLAAPTAAGEFSIVVGIAIVAGKFFSGADVPAGIKLHSAVGDSNENIGIAGMVDELKGTKPHAGVDCFRSAEFHDRNSFGSMGAFSGFPHRDQLAGELS